MSMPRVAPIAKSNNRGRGVNHHSSPGSVALAEFANDNQITKKVNLCKSIMDSFFYKKLAIYKSDLSENSKKADKNEELRHSTQ
jgi:hypothetical protein